MHASKVLTASRNAFHSCKKQKRDVQKQKYLHDSCHQNFSMTAKKGIIFEDEHFTKKSFHDLTILPPTLDRFT